jgi:hypothetical protein
MKTITNIIKTLFINLLISGVSFSQTSEATDIKNKPFQIVLSNYNTMNLGPKLNGFTNIIVSNENHSKVANTITENEFVSNWLLYQSDIKMIPLAQFNSESTEVKAAYTNMHAFIYAKETPTLFEIINYCKK